jgi:hypothetical protein
MWNDIVADYETEYEDWHANIHVQERLAIAGFDSARRYYNPSEESERYLTVYEIDSLRALEGAEYRRLLDKVTPETERLMAQFRHFTRGVCMLDSEVAGYLGGALRSWRFAVLPEQLDELLEAVRADARSLSLKSTVTAIQVGVCDRSVISASTREREIRERSAPDGTFDIVVFAQTRSLEHAGQLELRYSRKFFDDMTSASYVLNVLANASSIRAFGVDSTV